MFAVFKGWKIVLVLSQLDDYWTEERGYVKDFAFAVTESICIANMSLIPSFFGSRSSVFDPLSLDLWDLFEAGRSPFSRDLGHFSRDDATAIANTQFDWKETSDVHIFKADLPGLKKEEVKIEVEDGRVLQISGEHKKEEEQKNNRWHRIERSHGKFLRRFRLPENAKVEEVKAIMDNGNWDWGGCFRHPEVMMGGWSLQRFYKQDIDDFIRKAVNMSFFKRINWAWTILFPRKLKRTSNAEIEKKRVKMILFSDR